MNKRRHGIAAIVVIGLLTVVNSLMLVRQGTRAAPLAAPDVPQLIAYQGRLTDAAGNPLTGDYDVRFCLYAAPTGGSALWCETHAAVNDTAIPVSDGVFGVTLGSITSIPESLFDEPELYLGVKVEGDAEMTPRRRVVSVGYAYRAEMAVDADTVDGMHAGDFASASHTHPEIEGIPSGLIAVFDGGSCPAGWTRVAELDGKFLVGGASYNAAAGGANTHTHSVSSHSHSFSGSTSSDTSGDYRAWGAPPGDSTWNADASRGYHTHSFSGSTASGGGGSTGATDSRPEFATVLLCKKD